MSPRAASSETTADKYSVYHSSLQSYFSLSCSPPSSGSFGSNTSSSCKFSITAALLFKHLPFPLLISANFVTWVVRNGKLVVQGDSRGVWEERRNREIGRAHV